jgi:diaminohydroxyphosphoribosylaminopyrimidine deaminase/5-amino-6-(5-phosphoribosylamino)uracil reductase
MVINKFDQHWMTHALQVARKGRYAFPNPQVGAVIVRKNRILADGFHKQYGKNHAEIEALQKLNFKAPETTLYVTLEPCSHYGKTAPCVDAIIKAGISRVVASMEDPFPKVRGQGFKKLMKAGIKVTTGVLEKEARELNAGFIFSQLNQQPYVVMKIAMTLDGKIASHQYPKSWITNERSRKLVHEWRSRSDAILIGYKTVINDNPALTVRLRGFKRTDGWPWKVILDPQLQISTSGKIWEGFQNVLIFTSKESSIDRQKHMEKNGAKIFRVSKNSEGLNLKEILKYLYQCGVYRLLVEGGSGIFTSFLNQQYVNELKLFIAPRIFGSTGLPWFQGKMMHAGRRIFQDMHWIERRIQNDILIEGTFKKH